MADPILPPNICELNEITGVIFAKLYAVFPMLHDIDADAVAKVLGHSLDDKMESGRTSPAAASPPYDQGTGRDEYCS